MAAAGRQFASRMASVGCGVATLGVVAVIARTANIPVIPAVLLTLGCYGFAYTGAVARGFALAQLLSVAGIAMLLRSRERPARRFAAGMLMGAATFANYLAAFTAAAALLHAVLEPVPAAGLPRLRRLTAAGPMLAGLAVWLPAGLWFFAAQRGGRVGQFEPFAPLAMVARLARYQAATVFGGLPLYTDGLARIVVVATLCCLLSGMLVVVVRRWSGISTQDVRRLLAMAAAAPSVGLLLIGFAFDNAPIELRYLVFATPFIGLLLAAALPRWLCVGVLAVQALALLGLMSRPETMQPARASAIAAAAIAGDGMVMLPSGNDGVGIVGAFAVEAPASLRLLVIGRNTTPAQIRELASDYPRATLALLGQDAASRATTVLMRQAFADPCWRQAGGAGNVLAFDRVCGTE